MENMISVLSGFIMHIFHLMAILVLTVGITKAMYIYIKDALLGVRAVLAIQESRLELGHSFSLGLGFLIGGSILNTILAPTWDDIGQLASIIAIRTILNYFLLRGINSSVMRVAGDNASLGSTEGEN